MQYLLPRKQKAVYNAECCRILVVENSNYFTLEGHMCDFQTQQLIEQFALVKAQAGESFTAYDVTKAVRQKVGKGTDVPHSDVRQEVPFSVRERPIGVGLHPHPLQSFDSPSWPASAVGLPQERCRPECLRPRCPRRLLSHRGAASDSFRSCSAVMTARTRTTMMGFASSPTVLSGGRPSQSLCACEAGSCLGSEGKRRVLRSRRSSGERGPASQRPEPPGAWASYFLDQLYGQLQ